MERYLISKMDILIRLFSALIAGALIGFERERKGKAAGFVTNVLVCVGAASIAIIQCLIVSDRVQSGMTFNSDPGRIIAQVVSGVGFLGAGAILRDEGGIKGITTAAIIWVVAALGISFGMGYYFLGVVLTLIIYFSIIILKKMELYFFTHKVRISFYIEFVKNDYLEEKVKAYLENKGILVRSFNLLETLKRDGKMIERATIELVIPRYIELDVLTQEITLSEEVIKFKKLKNQKYKYFKKGK